MFGPNIHGSYTLFTLSKSLKPMKPRSGVSVERANYEIAVQLAGQITSLTAIGLL